MGYSVLQAKAAGERSCTPPVPAKKKKKIVFGCHEQSDSDAEREAK